MLPLPLLLVALGLLVRLPLLPTLRGGSCCAVLESRQLASLIYCYPPPRPVCSLGQATDPAVKRADCGSVEKGRVIIDRHRQVVERGGGEAAAVGVKEVHGQHLPAA